jgi:tetratricopeptide (TPR) repeat protein
MVRVNVSRRELAAVGAIWAILMLCAVGALLFLQHHAHSILYNLEYVSVNSFQKALALFTEAEQRTNDVLKKRQPGAPVTESAGKEAQDAVRLFENAFATDPRERFIPEHERYYAMLGDLLGAAGKPQPQLLAYARAAISRRDVRSAAEMTSRALNLGSDQTDAQLAAAQLAYVTGRKADVLTELAKVPPEQWGSEQHELKGRVLMENGDFAGALQEFQAALKGSRSTVTIRKRLASAYALLNRGPEAVDVLQKGRSEGGESDGNYMHILGDLLTGTNQPAEGARALEQAARLEPSSGAIQLSLARTYEKLGNKGRAQRALQRAITLEPKLQTELLKK